MSLSRRHCLAILSAAPLLEAAEPVRLERSMRLTFNSLGPVRVGMSVRQVSQVLRDHLQTSEFDEGCAYLEPVTGGVAFMLLHGRVARIDVYDAGWLTTKGIGVGDTELAIQKAYGPHVQVEPHAYTNGHYLSVNGPNRRILLFETDAGKVTQFRAGLPSAVAFVEGCA